MIAKSNPTVSGIVTRELEQNHLLLELSQQELLNISALARKLKPTIDRELRQRIPLPTISMAIRRHLASIESTPVVKTFPRHIDISTKTGVYEVAISRNDRNKTLVAEVGEAVLQKSGESLSVMEGAYEIVIYATQRSAADVKRMLRKVKKNSELENLACVTVDWPPSTKDVPGIYFQVTRALYFANVSIQSFHTIGAEMTIFTKEESLPRAHAALSELLASK